MNLTISPIRFKSFINNDNIKSDATINNNYYKSNKNDYNEAIRNYTHAAIGLQRKTLRKSPKQILSPNVFFINMYGYGLNKIWAQNMRDLLYVISEDISLGLNFDFILENIEKGINRINSSKKDKSSIYGIKRKRYHNFAMDTKQRGREYVERYSKKCQQNGKHVDDEFVYSPKANKNYENANTCTITTAVSPFFEPSIYIFQDSAEKYTISNLSLVKKEFNKLRAIENPTTEEVLRSCAIIQWLIAQETPYQRGSDSVANVLTKAIMHANNIYISPLKEGVSLDFEAFDTDLDDYIERYPNFFEVRPYKIEG